MLWEQSTKSGWISLNITKKQAAECTPQGVDAEPYIDNLRAVGYIHRQLKKLNAEAVREYLKEIGAWDAAELADDSENLTRLLWLACCDISENTI